MTIPGKLVGAVYGKVLAPDVTPAVIEKFKVIGINIASPEEKYTKKQWYESVDVMSQHLFPGDAKAHRKLGNHLISSLKERGIVKSAYLSMAKLLGPRKALEKAAEFAHYSPVKLTIEQVEKTVVEITVDDKHQPEFLAGLLETTLTMLGAKDTVVTSEGEGVFNARWK
jgi:uncharacterized protein (TIGR02265 family)